MAETTNISWTDATGKNCASCQIWHQLTEFGIDSSHSDGRTSSCKESRNNSRKKSYNPKPLSNEAKKQANRKCSETLKNRYKTQPHALKGRPSKMKGIPRSIEVRRKISQSVRKVALKGKECPSYKDGKVSERRGIRFSTEYKQWRTDVFLRDSFTCQSCGDDKGGNLVAHHIKSFAEFPELRLVLSNGLTLCNDCHHDIHYGY